LNEADLENYVSSEDEGGLSDQIVSMGSYCALVQKVQSYAESLGKDGKFQLFICLCAR